MSDTVLSTFKPPLTVQLLDGNGNPMSGQTVYFNTNGFVLAAPIDDPGFVTDLHRLAPAGASPAA